MKKECANCGAVNSTIASFCSECGQKLGKGKVYPLTVQDRGIGDPNMEREVCRRCPMYSDEDLIRIVEQDAERYTKIAISLAIEELRKRGYEINQTSASTAPRYHSHVDSTPSQASNGGKIAIIILIVLAIIVVGYSLFKSYTERNHTPTINQPAETKGSKRGVTTTAGSGIDTLVLEMTTYDNVWFSIAIDGKKRQEFLFTPQLTRVFKAQREFSIAMSNAGYATFKLNGKDIGLLGESGHPITNLLINKSNSDWALTSRDKIIIPFEFAFLVIKTQSGLVTTLQEYIQKKIQSKEWRRLEATYVQDVDNDGVNELVVESNSGGNTCCRYIVIFRQSQSTRQYEHAFTYEAAFAKRNEEVWADIRNAMSSIPSQGHRWQDGFEMNASYSFPSAWIADGNATDLGTNHVTASVSKSGTKALCLYGTVGGCWAGIAYHALSVSPPFELEVAVRLGNEPLTGCHPNRADISLRQGLTWNNPARRLVEFRGNGSIVSSAGNVLQRYATSAWYSIRIRYEKPSATQVRISYWIDGVYRGVETLTADVREDQMINLQLEAEEGSAWFDDVALNSAK